MDHGFETRFVISEPTKVVNAVAMWLEQAALALTNSNCDLIDIVLPDLKAEASAGITTMRVWSANELIADKLNQMAALLSDVEPMLTRKGAAA